MNTTPREVHGHGSPRFILLGAGRRWGLHTFTTAEEVERSTNPSIRKPGSAAPRPH